MTAPVGYDDGGWLTPGVGLAMNTGRPTTVLTPKQAELVRQAVMGKASFVSVSGAELQWAQDWLPDWTQHDLDDADRKNGSTMVGQRVWRDSVRRVREAKNGG